MLFENQNCFETISDKYFVHKSIKKPTSVNVVGWVIVFMCLCTDCKSARLLKYLYEQDNDANLSFVILRNIYYFFQINS